MVTLLAAHCKITRYYRRGTLPVRILH